MITVPPSAAKQSRLAPGALDRPRHQCRFFLAEIIAGVAAGSAALQADALDFFGDAANYAISLGVAGMALTWRARAAVAKGGTKGAIVNPSVRGVPFGRRSPLKWSAPLRVDRIKLLI
jgi:hypothetical protein